MVLVNHVEPILWFGALVCFMRTSMGNRKSTSLVKVQPHIVVVWRLSS